MLLGVEDTHADVFKFWLCVASFCLLRIELPHVLLVTIFVDECISGVVKTLTVKDIQNIVHLPSLLGYL